jgi:hypothetical protein
MTNTPEAGYTVHPSWMPDQVGHDTEGFWQDRSGHDNALIDCNALLSRPKEKPLESGFSKALKIGISRRTYQRHPPLP